jgi:lipoprotein-anchoring transpeptidase ErfK/SrfK
LAENRRNKGVTLVNARPVCDTQKKERRKDSKMTGVSGVRSSVATGTLLRIAALTAAGVILTASRTEAAVYYWQGSDPSYYQQSQPAPPPRRQKVRRSAPKKDEKAAAKETGGGNPQGPLTISVSIAKQQVKIYDDNGVFAQAPVSTGMPGHPTPMGVFSVIQKHKFHHSNIYSGAPMPYMQRITWSGVAMHAGVLPGYPASHGCIRMPMAFAVKMWNWTKMGARVFVTPGEIPIPTSFSHPFLPTLKVAPPPAVAELPPVESHGEVKADKGAAETAAAPSEQQLKLKSTVGQGDKPVTAEAAAPLEQTRTAEAAVKSVVTMSDAQAGPAREDAAAKTEATNIGAAKPDGGNPPSAATKIADTGDGVVGVAAKPEPAETAKAETRPEQQMAAAKADGDDAKAEPPASAPAMAQEKPAEPKLEVAKAEPSKAEASKPDAAKGEAVKPAEKAKAVGEAAANLSDAKKDQTRMSEAVKPAVTKPELPKRTGQIAVYISRKDSKLYVRQNFEPLFQVPVTIAASDHPFGTHVFTAEVDKTDTNVLHWSVVSIPTAARAARGDGGERVSSRRRKGSAPPVEAKAPSAQDSPAEVLDRITVPQEAMTRIAEAIATGGSIIVSDQGINQGETGEGTDFIVRMY